ncbi:Rid family hydrolase [Streptomyces diacarni]|uniref:Rid family hydrolase n=1 Tax=Streptomyces diacarni TaxID=2800381 RepID=UPI0033C3BB56
MSDTDGNEAASAATRNRSSSLRRALTVLDYVADYPDPAGASLTDIAQGLGLHKSTLLRLLTPLTDNGLVLRDAERARYRLGSHAAYLGGAYLDRLDLREVARGTLARLAERTGHTARLTLREADETVLVDAVEGSGPMPLRPRLGARRPLYDGAAGWALLARVDDGEVARVRQTVRTAARNDSAAENAVGDAAEEAAERLRTAVTAARRNGFALEEDGRAGPVVLGVDAAVLDHAGTPIAAVGLSGPVPGGASGASASALGAAVRAAAREVSHALGDRAGTAGGTGGPRATPPAPGSSGAGDPHRSGPTGPPARGPHRTRKGDTPMDRRQVISTQAAPQPVGAYSQAIVAGGFLHTAGLGPHDPVSGRVEGTSIAEQTEQTMRNLASVLDAHGLDFSDVVRATVHLQHLDRDFDDFNTAYELHLTPPYPVRTTVGADLANVLLEIDMTAVLR